METIIGALRAYFTQCPLLEEHFLNVDYLPEKPGAGGPEFSVDTTPAMVVLKRYASGCLKQYLFVVRSVNDYGDDQLQNIANSGLYEKLARWLWEQTVNGTLPTLPAGLTAQKLEALSTGYLFSVGPKAGKYQIQCALEYYEEGRGLNG